jgi:hypothetical protein
LNCLVARSASSRSCATTSFSGSPRESSAPRLSHRHGVDLQGHGRSRQHVVEAGGDEPRGAAPAVQERLEVPLFPDIVDDEQDSPVA